MATEQEDIFAAPQSDLETTTNVSLLDAFIGGSNTSFYKDRFAQFEQGGSLIGWHWPAFFVALLWLPHRKMWMFTLFYWLGLPIAVTILTSILEGFSLGLATVVESLIYVGLWLGFPTIATHFYYQHALRKIELVRQQFSSPEQQLQEVQRIGGTGIGGYVLGGVFVLLFLAGVVLGVLEAVNA